MYQRRLRSDELIADSFKRFRSSPVIAVPAILDYVLGFTASTIAFAFYIAFLFNLHSTGNLETFFSSWSKGDWRTLLSPAIFDPAVKTFAAMIIVWIAITLIGGSIVRSCLYGMSCELLTEGRTSLSSMLKFARAYWKPMLLTSIFIETIIWAPTILISLLLLRLVLSALSGMTVSVWTAVTLLLWLLPSFFYAALASFATMMAYPLVIIEGVKGMRAVERSVHVIMSRAEDCIIYAIMRIAFTGGLAMVGGLVGFFNISISTLLSTLILILILPILRLVKVGICTQEAGLPYSPIPPVIPSWIQLVSGKLKMGLNRLKASISNWDYAACLASASFIYFAGYQLGCSLVTESLREAIISAGIIVPGRISPTIAQINPISLAMEIFLHNWSISLALAISGAVFVIPTAFNLLINGFIVGFIIAVVKDPILTLSALAPHGSIELPAFLVAGGLGVRLGISYCLFCMKKATEEEFVECVKSTIYAVIGLIPFFFIAGMVEALVTPQIMRAFGWR